DEASSMPRPFGLSGCVTTSRIAKPASTRFSRVGTANAGVPQKTRLREEGIGLRTRTSDLRPQPRSGFETPAGARGPTPGFLYHSPAFISLRILRFMKSRFKALMWLMY